MAGHDINYIAVSGALHGIGHKDGKPVPPLNLVGDFGGGGMMLAFGILAAILNARRTGEGQVVDCAMTEGSAMLMAMIYGIHAQGRWDDRRGVNFIDSGAHFYDTYETADGKFMAVGAIEAPFYRTFLELLGLNDVLEAKSQHNVAAWDRQRERIAARFKERTRAEWCAVFEGQDACVVPVLSLTEAPHHHHIRQRGSFVEVDGVLQPAPAPRFSRTPGAIQNPPPHPGQDGDAVLGDWGFSAQKQQAMRAAGAVL